MIPRPRMLDRLEVFFTHREGQWVPGKVLADHFGYGGWRTRVSELRRKGYVIETRITHTQDAEGVCMKQSAYRLLGKKDEGA